MKKIALICLFMLAPFVVKSETAADLLTNSNADPIQEFLRWQEVAKMQPVSLAKYAALATIDGRQVPQQRFMYIKAVDKRGFVFVTSKDSEKVKEFSQNKHASLVFLWPQGKVFMQVRVTGDIDALGLATTRDPNANKDKKYYEYVLIPDHIQLALVDKSKEIVGHDYIDYKRDSKGAWERTKTNFEMPKVK